MKKNEYWIDGQYLAAPLDGFTQNQFREFWAGFDPLPPILDNARNQHYRTKDDLFATFELVNDWEPTEIAQQVAAALESPHVPQYWAYFRIVPSHMLEDAPSDFYRRCLSFLELLEKGNNPIGCFTEEYNHRLRQQTIFRIFKYTDHEQEVIETLTQYEFSVLSHILRFATETRRKKRASCSI